MAKESISLKKAMRIARKVFENNFTASASPEGINIGDIFLISDPSISKFANSFDCFESPPIMIRVGNRLSFSALPSLKNSGEKIIRSVECFFCKNSVCPTGIVDLMITKAS